MKGKEVLKECCYSNVYLNLHHISVVGIVFFIVIVRVWYQFWHNMLNHICPKDDNIHKRRAGKRKLTIMIIKLLISIYNYFCINLSQITQIQDELYGLI